MDKNSEELKELDEITKQADNLLEELNNLEGMPTSSPTQTNYLSLIKDMQNQMQDTILRGIQQNDRDLFLKGLEYYEKNYRILESIGDKRVCEDYQHEMIQILTELIVHFRKEINNPFRRYFILISLQFIAKIYEDALNFPRAVEIHLTVSKLLNSWASALEYSAIVLDYLLNDDVSKILGFLKEFDSIESKIYLINTDIVEQSIQSKRVINLKEFCEAIFDAFSKDLPVFLQDAKEYLEKTKLLNNFAYDRVCSLFNLLQNKFEKTQVSEKETPIEISSSIASESELLNNIKNVVLDSIGSQQTNSTRPLVSAKIDTSSIVNELKQFITSSIKGMSQEIINNVNKYSMAAPQPRGSRSSHVLDDAVPEIKVTGSIDPNDKPKRPKLSDVLDSIVVSD